MIDLRALHGEIQADLDALHKDERRREAQRRYQAGLIRTRRIGPVGTRQAEGGVE